MIMNDACVIFFSVVSVLRLWQWQKELMHGSAIMAARGAPQLGRLKFKGRYGRRNQRPWPLTTTSKSGSLP